MEVFERKVGEIKAEAKLKSDFGLACEVVKIVISGLNLRPERLVKYLESGDNPLGNDWQLLESCEIYSRFVSGKFDMEYEQVPPVFVDGEMKPLYEIVDGVLRKKRSEKIISYKYLDAFYSDGVLEIEMQVKEGSWTESAPFPVLKKDLETFVEGILDGR